MAIRVHFRDKPSIPAKLGEVRLIEGRLGRFLTKNLVEIMRSQSRDPIIKFNTRDALSLIVAPRQSNNYLKPDPEFWHLLEKNLHLPEAYKTMRKYNF